MQFCILIILKLILERTSSLKLNNKQQDLDLKQKLTTKEIQEEGYIFNNNSIGLSHTNYDMKKAIFKRFNMSEQNKFDKKLPSLYIHFEKNLLAKPVGGFMVAPAQNNEVVNVIYPSDERNYLQQADLVFHDSRDLQKDFRRTDDNIQELMTQSQKPFNIKQLMNGLSTKPGQVMLEKEQEFYDQQFYDFSSEKQKKTQNKQFTDLQRYLGYRQGYPDSQLAGIEFDNIPKLRIWNTLM